ncbi:hypothetical protein TrLO_g526 [Triparma laevis f. longispina]|uniref:Plastid lipid-associated protein/fibrillin conserved domain-containing protein n=1 Tax=Triparma laevis f. longispina TaxID=1714387 RepID=A0A9W7FIQ5_9STRA|nr:hypothetical protein TrLO_g526 [Triparma laevis f. longispina]
MRFHHFLLTLALTLCFSNSYHVTPHIHRHRTTTNLRTSNYLDSIGDSETTTITTTTTTSKATHLSDILRLSVSTLRGESPSSSSAYNRILSSIQGSGVSTSTKSDLLGTWTLVYSSSLEGLFRSSPFFLTARAVCKTDEDADKFEWFCTMHRKALAISRIGEVKQIITEDEEDASKLLVTNEFNTIAGAIPFLKCSPLGSGGLPIEIEGCITSTGVIEEKEGGEKGEYEIGMKEVKIGGSNIPGLRSLLDSEYGVLDTKKLGSFIESINKDYDNPKAPLKLVSLVDGIRIVRDESGIDYVYVKESDDEKPTDFSSRDADLGLLKLLEGFNDNVLKAFI